ncbi:hypothetical protein KBB89_01600 [Candidatus Gracilibacteria bacterium]|nr:hypothetical protein [Candidatus Gracilibacteria bacterium]
MSVTSMESPDLSTDKNLQLSITIASLLRYYAEQMYGPRFFASIGPAFRLQREVFAGKSIFPYVMELSEEEWRNLCVAAAIAITPSKEESLELRVQLLQETSLTSDQVEKILQN